MKSILRPDIRGAAAVDAPAGAAGARAGTSIISPHVGHLTRLPANSSLTWYDLPHLHVAATGMAHTPLTSCRAGTAPGTTREAHVRPPRLRRGAAPLSGPPLTLSPAPPYGFFWSIRSTQPVSTLPLMKSGLAMIC